MLGRHPGNDAEIGQPRGGGEIDLIVREPDGTLVFVEVRSRASRATTSCASARPSPTRCTVPSPCSSKGITSSEARRGAAAWACGAPATAVHVREVVLQVFRWAIERGQKVENPAELVRPTTIAKFEPRDRALTPDEIGLMYQYMERIGTTPTIRAAVKLLLLTMVRKSELKVDDLYRRPAEWTRQAILNVAGMGPFSSDRTIQSYADEIWKVKPVF